MSTASETSGTSVADETDGPSIPRGGGREAITAAAIAEFAERGFHGASIRDIAKRAGLSLSALYHWHSSKQDLLAALVEEGALEYRRACETALAQAGARPADRLRAIVRVTVDYRVRHRLESRILNRESRNLEPDRRTRAAELLEPASRLWVDILDAGIAEGEFRCEYPDDARRTIQAACNAISQWYDPEGGDITLAELQDRYAAIALRVVGHSA